MKIKMIALAFFIFQFGLHAQKLSKPVALKFEYLPQRWDEALPLGNGLMGELIWQKDDKLRISLDHAKLWDLRPMAELHSPNFNYKWVKKQLLANNYAAVQKIGDEPYERVPAPSKLPGAALEFNSSKWGKVINSQLNIEKALAEVTWENGTKMLSFVAANQDFGYFKFENLDSLNFELLAPKYQGEIDKTAGGSSVGDDLIRLGYTQGKVIKSKEGFEYTQKGWGGFYYKVSVKLIKTSTRTFEGVWTISAHYLAKPAIAANKLIQKSPSFNAAFLAHQNWWQIFWAKSSIALPDSVLQNQWYLEQYKFGSAARANTPPISLQAVWTADNGRLPPWKGDFHHDLNTQLSYWPAYSANHLDLEIGYLNHLDQNKKNYKKYTKWYFGTEGLNVPGVTDLEGVEMGGWIQYSMSAVVSAWLGQHFYLHWRYSMDRDFLKTRCYPWFKDVCKHLEQITYLDKNGKRQLPLSSSPEINDNKPAAWNLENSNYDLALMRFAFGKAAELAQELKLTDEAIHYRHILSQFDFYSMTANQELNFTKTKPYDESHRHMSHIMSVHPLGELRVENGQNEQNIIKHSLEKIEAIGPKFWVGYTYAWLGNLYARAKNGEKANHYLHEFATAFCSINSFHLNGDQTKTGKTSFVYRPFTLEGNFAFAAGIQEMLLQSYANQIEVFPAIPADWQNVSFENFRTEGAFIISAEKENGVVSKVVVKASEGGMAKIKLPFKTYLTSNQKKLKSINYQNGILVMQFDKNGEIMIKNGYE